MAVSCCWAAGAAADPPTRRPTRAHVLEAAVAGNVERLGELLRKRGRPWRDIDHLVANGHGEIATRVTSQLGARADQAAIVRYFAAPPKVPADLRTRFGQATALYGGKDYARAAEILLARPPETDSVPRVLWYYVLGWALRRDSRHPESLAAFERSMRAAEKLGWLDGQLRAVRSILTDVAEGDDYARHRRLLEMQLELAAALKRNAERERARTDLVLLLLREGDAENALPLLAREEAYYRAKGDLATAAHVQIAKANALGTRGHLATALLELEDAAAWFKQAAGRAEKQEGGRSRAWAALISRADHAESVRASFLMDLGMFEQAKAVLEGLLQAIDAGTAAPGPGRGPTPDRMPKRGRCMLLANLAHAHARLGEADEAVSGFEEALSVAQAIPAPVLEARTRLLRTAVMHIPQRRLDLARKQVDKARKRLEQHAAASQITIELYTPWVYATLSAAAIDYLDGQVETAAGLYDRVLSSATDLKDAHLTALAHAGLAAVHLERGNHQAALQQAREGKAHLERVGAGLADAEGLAFRGAASHAPLFVAHTHAAWKAGDDAELFGALDTARGVLLARKLGGRDALQGIGIPEDLAAQDRAAQKALRDARRLFAELKGNPRSKPADTRPAYQAIGIAESAVDAVLTKIDRVRQNRAGVAYPRSATLQEIQGRLPETTVFVLYAEIGTKLGALVVTSSGSRRVEIKASALTDSIKAINAVKLEQTDAPDTKKAHTELAAALVGALKLPKEVDTILVSPAGSLATLPWPLLLPKSMSASILLVPSPSTYGLLAAGPPAAGTGKLLLGAPNYKRVKDRALRVYYRGRPLDDLPGSEAEVGGVKSDGDTLLVGDDATETNLRSALLVDQRAAPSKGLRWAVVHLACHGVVDPVKAGFSALALGPSDQDDGFLTGAEVLRLDVPADLVVLSACDVGGGTIAHGEGLLGLVRAFMAAGTPRVLASLWPAGDRATAVLMKRFHDERNGGASNFDALRRAQKHVRDHKNKKGKRHWAHPFYWAGWVLWGLPREP